MVGNCRTQSSLPLSMNRASRSQGTPYWTDSPKVCLRLIQPFVDTQHVCYTSCKFQVYLFRSELLVFDFVSTFVAVCYILNDLRPVASEFISEPVSFSWIGEMLSWSDERHNQGRFWCGLAELRLVSFCPLATTSWCRYRKASEEKILQEV